MAVRQFPITDVQTWMGHADIAATRKHIHYAPQPEAAAKLGALVGEQLAAPSRLRSASWPVAEAVEAEAVVTTFRPCSSTRVGEHGVRASALTPNTSNTLTPGWTSARLQSLGPVRRIAVYTN